MPKSIEPAPQSTDCNNKSIKYENYLQFFNLSGNQRLKIYAKAAEGIAEVHKKHFTHGDIKPENILMTQISEQGNVFIIDYGGSTEKNEPPALFSMLYIDYDLAREYSGNESPAPSVYSEPTKLDIYAFALTIFELENSLEPQCKNYVDPWKGLPDENEMNLIKIHDSVAKNLIDIQWIYQRKINFITKDGVKFKHFFKRMIDPVRKNRPTALEVADVFHQLAAGKLTKTFRETIVECFGFGITCPDRKLLI